LPSECTYLGSVDSVLLKLIMLPSVARELALSIIVLTGSLRGEEYTEKASDSPPSKSSSMIASWGRRRVKNEECTSNKGECKPPAILATSLLIPTTANYVIKGAPTTTIRLLAPSRGRRTIEDTAWKQCSQQSVGRSREGPRLLLLIDVVTTTS
jgi:hypothetical protein